MFPRANLEIQEGVDEFFVLNPERSKCFAPLVIGQKIAIIDDGLDVVEDDRLTSTIRDLIGKGGRGEGAAAARQDRDRAENGHVKCAGSPPL